jgi:hypothetical protein
MIVLRALTRLVIFILLAALALAGLSLAVFSLQGGDDPLSLAALASHLELPRLRDTVGDYLEQLEADGPAATLSVLAGAAAVLVGLLLLLGAVTPRRGRNAVLAHDGEGWLSAKPGTLEEIASTLSRRVRGATDARADLRLRRGNRRGRMRVRISHPRGEHASDLERRTAEALAPLVDPFSIESHVTARVGRKAARVQ